MLRDHGELLVVKTWALKVSRLFVCRSSLKRHGEVAFTTLLNGVLCVFNDSEVAILGDKVLLPLESVAELRIIANGPIDILIHFIHLFNII